jgi:proline iminopeptidase
MDHKLIVMAAAIISAFTFAGCDEERFIDEPGNLVAKTVDQDLSLPSITVNGAMLHSEAFGNPDSTIIVCLHGGPGGDYRYLLNCKDLADHGYRVVFYDQRGSGALAKVFKEVYTRIGIWSPGFDL